MINKKKNKENKKSENKNETKGEGFFRRILRVYGRIKRIYCYIDNIVTWNFIYASSGVYYLYFSHLKYKIFDVFYFPCLNFINFLLFSLVSKIKNDGQNFIFEFIPILVIYLIYSTYIPIEFLNEFKKIIFKRDVQISNLKIFIIANLIFIWMYASFKDEFNMENEDKIGTYYEISLESSKKVKNIDEIMKFVRGSNREVKNELMNQKKEEVKKIGYILNSKSFSLNSCICCGEIFNDSDYGLRCRQYGRENSLNSFLRIGMNTLVMTLTFGHEGIKPKTYLGWFIFSLHMIFYILFVGKFYGYSRLKINIQKKCRKKDD